MSEKWITGDQNEILKQRARELAYNPEAELNEDEFMEVVEFRLGAESYGISLKSLTEIYPCRDLTPLPCAPPFLAGMVNVRSEILSVIDLKKIFQLPATPGSSGQKLVVVHAAGMILGILADAVVGVRSIPLREIQPSLSTLAGIDAEYLRGITPQRLIILEIEKILSNQQMLVYEES